MNNKLKFKNDRFAFSDVRQTSTKKVVAVIAAIVISFVLAMLITSLIEMDITLLWKVPQIIFTSAFDGMAAINKTISSMAILIVSALAFLIAFKAGLFNMGVSGQMIAGATAATMFAHYVQLPNGVGQIVILLISVMVAMFVAGLIGAMKAYLNVNEVVSSIMFNWIIYFLSVFTLKNIPGSIGESTSQISENYSFITNGSSYLPLIIMAGILVAVVFVYLSFTVAGRKSAIIGKSKTAAKAAGYSVSNNIIGSMLFSGALAGVLGVMVYCGYSNQMPITTVAKSIPIEGFNGISVGLISMCSPLATMPISLFFAMIQSSNGAIQNLGVDSTLPSVIFGIVVYGAAVISLFILFRPYWLLIRIFKGKRYLQIKRAKNLDLMSFNEYVNDQQLLLKRYYKEQKILTKTVKKVKLSFNEKIQMKLATLKYNFIMIFNFNNDFKSIKLVELIWKKTGMLYHDLRTIEIQTMISVFEKNKEYFASLGINEFALKNEFKIYKNIIFKNYLKTRKEIKKFYSIQFKNIKSETKNNILLKVMDIDKLFFDFDQGISQLTKTVSIKKESQLKTFSSIQKFNHELLIAKDNIKLYSANENEVLKTKTEQMGRKK